MQSLKKYPVLCVVGDRPDFCVSDVVESFPQRYYATPDELLQTCRCTIWLHAQRPEPCRVWTNDQRFIVALQAMHRMGEIELKVRRSVDGDVRDFDFDAKGDFIQPWPDEFFEIEFHIRLTPRR